MTFNIFDGAEKVILKIDIIIPKILSIFELLNVILILKIMTEFIIYNWFKALFKKEYKLKILPLSKLKGNHPVFTRKHPLFR